MSIGKKILAIKEEIQSDNDKMNQFKGQRTELFKELKDSHKITSLDQANAKLKSLGTKTEKLGEELQEDMDSLIKKYGLEDIC